MNYSSQNCGLHLLHIVKLQEFIVFQVDSNDQKITAALIQARSSRKLYEIKMHYLKSYLCKN